MAVKKIVEFLSLPDVQENIVKFSICSSLTYLCVKILLKQTDPSYVRKSNAVKKASANLSKLGLNVKDLTEYETVIASHLVSPNDIKVTWNAIGGLDGIIREIKEIVIFPILRKDLFEGSHLIQPPKGVLLYGPPGCGKTMIAKATASEAGTRFINLDLSILTDKWYGESQKLAAAVFSLAAKIEPCIIFIDEIDSFLRCRNAYDHEATAMMKAQFMTLWDGLNTDPSCMVVVMGATNRPNDLDPAIRRRMPAAFHIALPSTEQRVNILTLILKGEKISDDIDLDEVAEETEFFSGSDLRELCREAAMHRLRSYVNIEKSIDQHSPRTETLKMRPISMNDFTKSIIKMKNMKVNFANSHQDD